MPIFHPTRRKIIIQRYTAARWRATVSHNFPSPDDFVGNFAKVYEIYRQATVLEITASLINGVF